MPDHFLPVLFKSSISVLTFNIYHKILAVRQQNLQLYWRKRLCLLEVLMWFFYYTCGEEFYYWIKFRILMSHWSTNHLFLVTLLLWNLLCMIDLNINTLKITHHFCCWVRMMHCLASKMFLKICCLKISYMRIMCFDQNCSSYTPLQLFHSAHTTTLSL